MGHEFEDETRAELDVTPDQIWAAIATGPGIDSWFMGRNQVVPGQDGSVTTDFGAYAPVHRITGWEPGKRLAHGTAPAEDGRFVAYEFLIEGRAQGSTVLRLVAQGFLPADDWEDEYEAMTAGGALFFRTLVEYLRHFAGRTATPVTAAGPMVPDWDRAWAALRKELGGAAEGDRVGFGSDGLGTVDGVVYFTNSQTLGIRTPDALLRFVQGLHGPMLAMHHIFSDTDPETTGEAWSVWLHRVLGQNPEGAAR
jgi:uncharacterized protein YndB with AHSA1/START domain